MFVDYPTFDRAKQTSNSVNLYIGSVSLSVCSKILRRTLETALTVNPTICSGQGKRPPFPYHVTGMEVTVLSACSWWNSVLSRDKRVKADLQQLSVAVLIQKLLGVLRCQRNRERTLFRNLLEGRVALLDVLIAHCGPHAGHRNFSHQLSLAWHIY